MNNSIKLEPKKNKIFIQERKVNRDHILFLQHSHPVGSRDLQKKLATSCDPLTEAMPLGPYDVTGDAPCSPLLYSPLAFSCLECYLRYDIQEGKLLSSCVVGEKNLLSIKTKERNVIYNLSGYT